MSLNKSEHEKIRVLAQKIKETSRKVMGWEVVYFGVIFATVFLMRGIGFGAAGAILAGSMTGLGVSFFMPKDKLKDKVTRWGGDLLDILEKEPEMDQKVVEEFRKDIFNRPWRRAAGFPPRLNALMKDYQEVMALREAGKIDSVSMVEIQPETNQEDTHTNLPDLDGKKAASDITSNSAAAIYSEQKNNRPYLIANSKPQQRHQP